jgi:hypothetical protein
MWPAVRSSFILTALLCGVTSTVGAQPTVGTLMLLADVGATQAGGNGGLGLSGGLARRWSHVQLAAAVELIIGQPGGGDRYYRDPSSEGQNLCRDQSTGQAASDWRCRNLHVTPGLITMFEVTPFTKVAISAGLGFRAGDTYGGVGSLGFVGPIKRTSSYVRFIAIGGREYWSLRFGVAMPLTSVR